MSNKVTNVAVLMGGSSAEREVSLKSGAAVLRAFEKLAIPAFGFDPAQRSLTDLIAAKPTQVFIALHGRGGEDGTMQGALEQLGLAYTGSRVLGSALAMDKVRCKQIWQNIGLPTASYQVINDAKITLQQAQAIIDELGGKVFVKPAKEGSSVGMSIATSAQQLLDAVTLASQYDTELLVEQYIDGEEFTVAIVDGQVLPSIRMQTPNEFYDYEAKYLTNTTEYFCPSGISQTQEQILGQIALQAYDAVAVSGWGRVDFMQDRQGNFYLLEINTAPGMTEKSLVPLAAKQAGMSFEQLVLRLTEAAH
ncbi:D-alanine--D-alanine ligase [Paraferrimonas sp. SM1919]|uniref:D-alanine--D-alanine ligase n=1 Tax=Paraferrimonas sp. SM1919 TaxID=2662263 RepID=UPI0013D14B77|nr:D-alanine--D-alanine ligase [Paraferrimonas sp. SM1919]